MLLQGLPELEVHTGQTVLSKESVQWFTLISHDGKSAIDCEIVHSFICLVLLARARGTSRVLLELPRQPQSCKRNCQPAAWSPSWHSRLRKSRQKARALVCRVQTKGLVDSQVQRFSAAQRLLENHHSRPCSSLPDNIIKKRVLWYNVMESFQLP